MPETKVVSLDEFMNGGGFESNPKVVSLDEFMSDEKDHFENRFQTEIMALTPERKAQLREPTPQEEKAMQLARDVKLAKEYPNDYYSGVSAPMEAFAQGVLPIRPKDISRPGVEEAYPVAKAVGNLAGTLTTGVLLGGIAPAVTFSKQLASLPTLAKFAAGKMAQTGATFGLKELADNMAEIVSGDKKSFQEVLGKTAEATALGTGLGAVGTIPQPLLRIPAEAAYGFSTAKMMGANNFEAGVNGAIYGVFGMLNSANLTNEYKIAAFNAGKQAMVERLTSKGLDLERAQVVSDRYFNWAINRAGGWGETKIQDFDKFSQAMRKGWRIYVEPEIKPEAARPAQGLSLPVKLNNEEFGLLESAIAKHSAGETLTPEEIGVLNKIKEPEPSVSNEISGEAKQAEILDKTAELISPKAPEIKSDEAGKVNIGAIKEFGTIVKDKLLGIKDNINPEQLKPDISGVAPLQKRITNMEERLARVDAAKYALEDIETVREYFRRRITKYKDAYLKEELTGIPSSYLTKEGGIKPDEAIDELRNHFGVEVNDEVGLKEYFQNLDKARNDLLDEIETNKPQLITKRETTLLNERIKAVEQGIREGKLQAREETKDIQKQFVEMIETSGLSTSDKAKFLRFEKNIQTPEQFQKAIPEIINRIQILRDTGEKKTIEKQIGKELKYTKPVKEGQRRVGKYDYETNKFFEDIRRINNLSQEEAQAELDAMPTENLMQADIIKTRILSLVANGMSGSLELHRQVLEDIKLLKQIGEEAKDEADFNKKLQRHRAVEEISEAIDRIKGDKDSIITKIENVYRLGFSNIYSMLNSIVGKDIAENYDPEPKENNREIAIYERVNETADRIAELLGVDNFPAVIEAFQDMAAQEFEIVDSEGLRTEINKLGLLDIYNSIKNDLVRDRYYNAFGKEQVTELLANLTPAEESIADYMQEVVQEYREILNQRSIEITGRDLGEVLNYWPATSEFQQSVTDDIRLQGEIPSALKARSQSAYVIPLPKDAWLKFLKHVSQAEHVQHLTREYETLKRIFQDRKIKNQITNKFGEKVYRTLLDQIDNISLHKQTEKLDAISEVWGVMVNNWVKAKVAFNPSIFFKQLISLINYAENMPAGEWSIGFFRGLAEPKQAFDFMWKNSKGFLEERFNRGYAEALREAIKGASMIGEHKSNWAMGLTALARAGDITAIIYGGYPYVQWQMSQGKSMEEAFEAFRRSTLKSQQSGMSSGLSQWQNTKNPAWRIYLAFKNTANQYLRKQADAIISYRNNQISGEKLAKTTIIYSVINPLLYALVGYGITRGWKAIGKALFGTKERRRKKTDDDLVSSLMIQLAINPLEAVFVLNDISEYVARKVVGKKTYGVISTPVIDDISKAFQKSGKKNPTLMDYFEGSGTFAEFGTGLPILTGLRIFKYLTGEKKGPLSVPVKKVWRRLGF